MRLAPVLSAVAVAGLTALAACEPPPPRPQGDAEALALIDRARTHHGSALLDRAEVTFSFRGTPYVVRRDEGAFRYARARTDSLGRTVEEVLDNDGVRRLVDGAEQALAPDEAASLAESIDSVVYFALLPASLADPAVRARVLTPDRVGGEDYDRVEVTFARDQGANSQDRYVYWLRDDGRIGAFAYAYAPTPGDTARTETGTRFRVPIGERRVGGVLFQDWQNLTADSLRGPDGPIEAFGDALDNGRTFPVSEVVLDSVAVRPL